MVLNTVWEEYRDIECYPVRSGKTLSITSKKIECITSKLVKKNMKKQKTKTRDPTETGGGKKQKEKPRT